MEGNSIFATRLSIVGKWLIALVISLWTAIDIDIKMLVVLSLVDVITSLFVERRLFFQVTRRLVVTFLLVGVTHYVFSMAKINTGLNVGFDVGAVVCVFYILGELIIIIRNCSDAGLIIPPQLLEILIKAEGLTGSEKKNILGVKLKQDGDSVKLEVKMKPPPSEDS